jgi:hypothetical protein
MSFRSALTSSHLKITRWVGASEVFAPVLITLLKFIYNAVAANCVEVATHRHGCCVLQRCIDHASDHQRIQLVNEITYNALTLVQDPYGNYVSK